MSAVKELQSNENVVLTGAALNVVDCFRDGLDEVVVQMAEDLARARHTLVGGKLGTTITIEARDVTEAGNQLIRILNEQIASGKIPASMSRVIQGINDCVTCK